MQLTADDADLKDADLVLPKTSKTDEAAWLIASLLC